MPGSKPTIIAELAQGYEGKPWLARALVAAAAAAGADGAKFQLVYADELATPDYEHYALFKTLEMPDAEWESVNAEARSRGLALYFDIFGTRSLRLAETLGAAGVKIHSTDAANMGLLQEVARSGVPLVLLSTASCGDDEVREAMEALGDKPLVLLHGFQGYPTPLDANRIARLKSLARVAAERRRGTTVLGFADHAPAEDALRFLLPAIALGAGAVVFEKHLTLSKVMTFEDHEAALNPDELAEFVARMRECDAALGAAGASGEQDLPPSELEYRRKTRKHVVAARDIAAGERLSADMVALLRTSSAEVIYDPRRAYGRVAARAIGKGVPVNDAMLEN